MVECSSELKRTVPLRKVISAAIVDTYEDIGRVEHMYTHWAARGFKMLDRQTLKTGLRKVILTVNRNTNTATLPPDFGDEQGVWVIINDKKVPLKLRTNLVDTDHIEELECVDKCERCNQDKGICKELTVTQDTVLINIEGQLYEQTVIKKMEPDGSYFLITNIPVWDYSTSGVIYHTTKEYITSIDLKPCGCVSETAENIEKIRCCSYDVYCSYFAPCEPNCINDHGGYQIFEESGLIKFNKYSKFTKVYMEYWGFMPKINGQYHVPEVAFEALVEWVKYMSIDAKPNVPNVEKRWRYDRYRIVREDMLRVMTRISLSVINTLIGMVPKFDVDDPEIRECCGSSTTLSSSSSSSDDCSGSSGSSGSGDNNSSGGSCPPNVVCPPSTATFVPFSISEIAGLGDGPTPGVNTYQNNKLIGATGIVVIIVNNTPETERQQQWTIDYVTGTISRWQADGVTPNLWFAGDVLVIPPFFKLM